MTKSIDQIETLAQRDQQRYERLTRWRLSGSWRDFVLYLLWRNRYPLAQKIVFQVTLLLEVYLLSQLTELPTLASILYLLFILNIAVGLFSGIKQYFRVRIGLDLLANSITTARQHLRRLLVLGLAAAMLIATAFFTTALFYVRDPPTVALLAVWLIIIPLEFGSGILWMAVYTKRRLARRISIISTARLLPSLSLIALGSWYGAYSYISALLVARVLENCYLSWIAIEALKREQLLPSIGASGTYFDNHQAKRESTQTPTGSEARAYFLSNLWPELFLLSIGTFLALRDESSWVAFFVLFHLANLLAYPLIRVTQSIGMDFYLAVCRGNLRRFSHLRSITERTLLVVAGLGTAIFLIAVGWIATLNVYLGDFFFELWPYLLLLSLAIGLFYAEQAVHKAIGTDRHFNLQFFGLFFLSGCGLAWWLLWLEGGNLALALIIFSLTYFLGFVLQVKKRQIIDSPFFAQVIRAGTQKQLAVPPFLAVQILCTQRTLYRHSRPLLLDFDYAFCEKSQSTELLRQLQVDTPEHSIFVSIVPGLYLLIPPASSTERLLEELRTKWSGYLRTIIRLDPDIELPQQVDLVIQKLILARNPQKLRRSLTLDLPSLIKSGSLLGVHQEISALPSENFSTFERATEVFYRLLQSKFPALLPGRPGREVLNLANIPVGVIPQIERIVARSLGNSHFISQDPKGTRVLTLCGQPLLILSASALPSKELAALRAYCRALDICISVRLSRELTDVDPVAADIIPHICPLKR